MDTLEIAHVVHSMLHASSSMPPHTSALVRGYLDEGKPERAFKELCHAFVELGEVPEGVDTELLEKLGCHLDFDKVGSPLEKGWSKLKTFFRH